MVWHTFLVKGQVVNIFSFANYSVLLITPYKHKSSLSWYINEWVWLHLNKMLFTKTGDGSDTAHSP